MKRQSKHFAMNKTPILSIDEVQAFLVNEFPQVADDYVVEAIGPNSVRLRMDPTEKHIRPGGTVSGPTLFALADCAVYLCIIGMVGPEALESPQTLRLTTCGSPRRARRFSPM